MAELIFDSYKGQTDYSDGESIEKQILDIVKNGDIDQAAQSKSWPIVYHLSSLRENILNWYPFKKGSTILEVGSGCGALTGLLCDRAKAVVSVELTERRALINYERHKSLDNLKIMVGNLEDMCFEERFDYAIINGVLEYSGEFMKGRNPHVCFLQAISSFLKDNGIILLAIENRLGLKYFSGAREDHLGGFFDGINGYIGKKIRTFSKEELNELIDQAELHAIKYFYPFPDYKFPFEIFSDSTVNSMEPRTRDIALEATRVQLFDNRNVYRSLMLEKVMDRFSNSFLVEIAKSKRAPVQTAYVKLSTNRYNHFKIMTYFENDKKRAFKKALHQESEQHIEHMKCFGKYQRNSLVNINCSAEALGAINFPYVNTKSFDTILMECFRNGLSCFIAQISNFRDMLYSGVEVSQGHYSTDFQVVFGTHTCAEPLHWLNDANIDLIADNIFPVDGNYYIIDYEWHMPCMVPLEFVLWRMIRQFIDSHSLCEQITETDYYQIIGINHQIEECFLSWEKHFAYKYVGIVELDDFAKPIVHIDLEKAVSAFLGNELFSTLFFDTGQGFTDINIERVHATLTTDGYTVVFNSKHLRRAKQIRWDPIEGHPCKIKIEKIESDMGQIDVDPLNAETEKEGDFYIFYTFDPQFVIKGDMSSATYIKICFQCEIQDWRTGYMQREIDIALCQSTIEMQKSKLDELKTNMDKINTDMQNSRIKSAAKILMYGQLYKKRSDS